MSEPKFTPGPWQYVEGIEHHGPYVTNDFGTTIADLYAMSNPSALSVRNGGDSKPIVHMAEMADPNARLIAAAPDHALIAAALCSGFARWEARTDEFCMDGLRHSTKLDEFGVPVMTHGMRTVLSRLRA